MSVLLTDHSVNVNKVRDIQVSDYRSIYRLNLDFNPNLRDFGEERVREKIIILTEKTKDKVIVYERNGEVIGYIHGSPYELLFSDSLVNVLGFVVREGDRNQGIGGILIGSLERWARDNRYSGLKLLSHPSRTNAHRFYEKRGYTFTKDQKNFMKKF